MQSQYTNVGGISMHARVSVETLPENAIAIVLVHGFVISSRNMVPTAELLAADYRVYAPDLPGYGESEKPGYQLSLSDLADVLCRWMDEMGIDRATLLGNSFGCQIIVEFALRHRDRIERAILQGPTIDRHARTLEQQIWRLLKDAPYEKASQLPIQIYDFWRAGFDLIAHTLNLTLSDAIEKKLPYVEIPTLVVRGKEDPLVPQQWAEEVVELLPKGNLAVIPGGGHTLNYSAPLELVRVTKAFINSTSTNFAPLEN